MLYKLNLNFFYLALLLTACNKETEELPTEFTPGKIPPVYWISNGAAGASIVKGIQNADNRQLISQLYTPAAGHILSLFVLNASGKELYWAETDVTANAPLASQIYAGDTLGGPARLIANVPAMINSLAVNAAANQLYWTQYDSTNATDQMYSCSSNGGAVSRMFTSDTLHAVSHITVDTVTQSIYFIENYSLKDSVGRFSRISRGELNGSRRRLVIYDKKNWPVAVGAFDWFSGIVVNGNNVYLAVQPGATGGISYIFKGTTDGAVSLASFMRSTSVTSENILNYPLALAVDKKKQYLYWINRGSETNGVYGSIYRTTFTAPASTEKVFDNVNVTGASYAALETGLE